MILGQEEAQLTPSLYNQFVSSTADIDITEKLKTETQKKAAASPVPHSHPHPQLGHPGAEPPGPQETGTSGPGWALGWWRKTKKWKPQGGGCLLQNKELVTEQVGRKENKEFQEGNKTELEVSTPVSSPSDKRGTQQCCGEPGNASAQDRVLPPGEPTLQLGLGAASWALLSWR